MKEKPGYIPFSVRENKTEDLSYRTLGLRMDEKGVPATLDEATRSVEVVGATENPVDVWDWERWEIVKEVLLMSGCVLPATRQVILLDTHQRSGTAGVIGSYRDMRIESEQMVGRTHFTSLSEGEGPWIKLREGHLTDFSVGYRALESIWIPAGETQTVKGRKYAGPLKVTTRWAPRELSICPLGADELGKARTAAENKKPFTEVTDMNKQLREKLIARGMNPDATEQEAWAYLAALEDSDDILSRAYATPEPGDKGGAQPPEPPKAPEGEDPEGTAKRAIQEERERVAEIEAVCRRYDIPEEMRQKLIADGTPLFEARDLIWQEAEKRRGEDEKQKQGVGFRTEIITMGADERDKFRSAARDALMIRAGFTPEKPAAGAEDLSGYRMIEVARMSLRMAGQPTGGHLMEMVGRAMQTEDFQHILSNVANKSLFEGFGAANETWRDWCATGRTPDFKTNTIARLGEMDDLDEIPEKGRYRYGEREDAKEQYKMTTYGKIFPITRQAIVNDDLGAFTDIPREHGEAAARKVGDLPYAVLVANAAMGDGTALFHADHGNLGTAGVPSETTMAEAIKKMKLQKDIGGKRRLNLRAEYFVAPVTLEGGAEIFFTSNNFTGGSGKEASTRTNPYAGSRFTRVYEARLDDSSTTAYYLMGPRGKTVKVFFLDGNENPYLETKAGWTVDGQEFKVRIDAVAKAVAWEAMFKNAGA